MTLLRWTFHEETLPGISVTDALADWTIPVNPARMSAPEMIENISAEPRNVDSGNRDTESPRVPVQWTFEGVLYTLAELDTLEAWLDRGHVIHLTDHFGRTWRVLLEDVNAVRNGSHIYPERHRYTATCQMLGEVTT